MSRLLAPMDLTGLKDKAVLLFGSASGIGLETASLFASNGAFVTIADIQNPPDGLTSGGRRVQYVQCDVSDWGSQINAFKKAIDFSPTKTLDVVATFAAIDPLENLIDQVKGNEKVSLEADLVAPPFLRTIDINLKGSIYSATLALHYFRLPPEASSTSASQPKALILTSSLAGYIDDDHNPVYTASKFGTRGLFRALRRRVATEFTPGVRINLIAPWAVKTPMTAPILQLLEGMGIHEGKGITFATTETCAQAVGRCAVDESLHGRAFAIVPEGAFDIKDDIEGGYGGKELETLMSWRKAAGDFLTG